MAARSEMLEIDTVAKFALEQLKKEAAARGVTIEHLCAGILTAYANQKMDAPTTLDPFIDGWCKK